MPYTAQGTEHVRTEMVLIRFAKERIKGKLSRAVGAEAGWCEGESRGGEGWEDGRQAGGSGGWLEGEA